MCVQLVDHGATGALLGPCTRHMHQAPRLRNGFHFSASSIISFSAIYFHFDVFPLAFAIFFPVHTAIPLWIPKSPVDNTSGRFNANIKNISAPNIRIANLWGHTPASYSADFDKFLNNFLIRFMDHFLGLQSTICKSRAQVENILHFPPA